MPRDIDEGVRVPVGRAPACERVGKPCKRIGKPRQCGTEPKAVSRRVEEPVEHEDDRDEVVDDDVDESDVRVESS